MVTVAELVKFLTFNGTQMLSLLTLSLNFMMLVVKCTDCT